jgi:16S rRNA (adenine1518-N6/adenine1519-N6)-dimethyltransferase
MKWSKTRAFGQHYLADKRILREIVKTSQINSEEIVCEAGTGKGILTQELCKHAKKVISFEIDKPLYLEALNSFSHLPNLLLINTDIVILSLTYLCRICPILGVRMPSCG